MFTLHKLFGLVPNGEGDSSPPVLEQKPTVIIIDEVSMVNEEELGQVLDIARKLEQPPRWCFVGE